MIPTGKKIAILHPRVSTQGGAVSMMLYLANILKEQGNEVVFFTTEYNSEIFGNVQNISFVIGTKRQLIFKIKDFDYMFIGNSPMHFVGVLSKIIHSSKVKIFWWHHHYPWYYKKNANFYVFLKKILEKFFVRYIDEMIVNSLYLKKSIRQIYERNSKVLYPVVDKIFLNVNKNKKINTPILFSYGRWVGGKNVKQIFQTYDALKNKIPGLELRVAGVGYELDFYKNQYKKDKNVLFLGLLKKEDLVYHLHEAKVFLFPSLIDSFGMSALEAVYSGIPVVGFNKNGITEIVHNGKKGYLVESDIEFTEKVFQLLTNSVLYNSIIHTIKASCSGFSKIDFTKQLEKIF